MIGEKRGPTIIFKLGARVGTREEIGWKYTVNALSSCMYKLYNITSHGILFIYFKGTLIWDYYQIIPPVLQYVLKCIRIPVSFRVIGHEYSKTIV